MERTKKGKRILPAVLALAVLALLTAGLLWMEYGNYREQVRTAAAVLRRESDGAPSTRLLKEGLDREEIQRADGLLREYGYDRIGATGWGRRFQRNCLFVILGAAAFYLLLLLALFYGRAAQRRQRKQELEQIGRTLTGFRRGEYEKELWTHLEDEADREIYLQLESLAGSLQVLREQSVREREETKVLVTDISHQLKTPVAALAACFEVLGKPDLTAEEREEFSKRCAQQMRGLEHLVKALIQISRMETGIIQIHQRPEQIFTTLLEAVNRVYPAASERKIGLELEAEEKLRELRIFHDPKWLGEALINLLENGVKYSPEGSKIMIRMAERPAFLRIEIQDEGIGIPKEEQHRIFKRFYRGSSRQVRTQTGSGVGLYLVREIVERHGGTVTVTSPAGQTRKGSIFVLQLPYGGKTERSLTNL